jgi:hypothetical protein
MIGRATFGLALVAALTFGAVQAASAHGGHFGGGHFGGGHFGGGHFGHHFGFHHGPGFFFGGPYYGDYDDYDDDAACYRRVHIRHHGWRWVWICN